MRITKDKTAAVVIDIQEKLLPHISEGEAVVKNCVRLIEGLKLLSVPMLVTQQYTRGLGPTVPGVASMFQVFSPVEKIAFSCCDEPSFMKQLTEHDKQFILLCGIEAHVCVLQTCLDLLEKGFIPVVAEDAVSSRRQNDKKVAVKRMRQEGARITTTESILFELTREAGNQTFRAISALVK
jgi:nicotinamidase-related amidase